MEPNGRCLVEALWDVFGVRVAMRSGCWRDYKLAVHMARRVFAGWEILDWKGKGALLPLALSGARYKCAVRPCMLCTHAFWGLPLKERNAHLCMVVSLLSPPRAVAVV